MWLPKTNFSYTENKLINHLTIPKEITFGPIPEDTIEEFKSIVADYPASYEKLYSKHKAYITNCALANTISTLQNVGLIEANFLQKPYVASLPPIDYPMYTEALLLKLQTLTLSYPMLLACLFVTPRKQYTQTDFSAAYYIYCIKTGFVPTTKSNYEADQYPLIELLRRNRYIIPQPTPDPLQATPLTPNDRPHRFNVRSLDKPPLPRVLAYITFDNVTVPYFVFSRWGCEHYFVTPIQATTANKLLAMGNLPQNNLLKPPTKLEAKALNLADQTNMLNAAQVFSGKLKLDIFNLPEIVDFNTLLGLPPSNKKADMFLKLPIVRFP